MYKVQGQHPCYKLICMKNSFAIDTLLTCSTRIDAVSDLMVVLQAVHIVAVGASGGMVLQENLR